MNLQLSTFFLENNNDHFRLELQKQLAKDFNSVGKQFPENFNEELLALGEIYGQVSILVSELAQISQRSILQLLYIIDIPEGEFQKIVLKKDFIAALTISILEREAKKVYFRKKYSK